MIWVFFVLACVFITGLAGILGIFLRIKGTDYGPFSVLLGTIYLIIAILAYLIIAILALVYGP